MSSDEESATDNGQVAATIGGAFSCPHCLKPVTIKDHSTLNRHMAQCFRRASHHADDSSQSNSDSMSLSSTSNQQSNHSDNDSGGLVPCPDDDDDRSACHSGSADNSSDASSRLSNNTHSNIHLAQVESPPSVSEDDSDTSLYGPPSSIENSESDVLELDDDNSTIATTATTATNPSSTENPTTFRDYSIPSEVIVSSLQKELDSQNHNNPKNNPSQRSPPKGYMFAGKLISILSKAPGAPRYLFDEIKKLLAEDEAIPLEARQFFRHFVPSHKEQLKWMTNRYSLTRTLPVEVEVVLHTAAPGEVKTKITVNPLVPTIAFLLGKLKHSHPNDLAIKADEILTTPPPLTKNSQLGEITTGLRYRAAYLELPEYKHKANREAIRDKKPPPFPNNVTCLPFPLMMELDKTHNDATGKLTTEQLRCSSPWFTREQLRSPDNWMPLGCIPNSQLNPNSHHSNTDLYPGSGSAKNNDFQRLLDAILTELKVVTAAGGLDCRLELPCLNSDSGLVEIITHQVRLVPYLLVFLGDSLGHSQVASCYSNKTKSQQFCHMCTIPREKTGDLHHVAPPKNPSLIKKLVSKFHKQANNYTAVNNPHNIALNKMSVYPVNNCFMDGILFLDRHISNLYARGIYGSLPFEILHVLQKGLYVYELELFFEQKEKKKAKQPKKKASKKTGSQEEEPDPPGGDIPDAPPGRRIISEAKLKLVNALAYFIGSQIDRCPDKDRPRMKFKHGVTSDTHRSANEMQGLMLHIAILLCTGAGQKLLEKQDQSTRTKWIKATESLLLMEEYMKSHSSRTLADIEACGEYVRHVLMEFQDVLSRTKGLEANFLKMHLPQHLCECETKFGPLANVTSEGTEERHRPTKDAAKTTQHRLENFDTQTTRNAVEFHSVAEFRAELEWQAANYQCTPSPPHDPIPPGKEPDHNPYLYGNKYQLLIDSEAARFSPKVASRKRSLSPATFPDAELQGRIQCFFYDHVYKKLCHQDCHTYEVFTDVRMQLPSAPGTSAQSSSVKWLRSHPEYKPGEPWFDWCHVLWPVTMAPADDDSNSSDVDPIVEMDEFPCRVVCLFDLPEDAWSGRTFLNDEIVYADSPGMYAIIESLRESDQNKLQAHPDSWLLEVGTKCLNLDTQQPQLFLVPVHLLKGKCIAFSHPSSIDPKSLEIQTVDHEYLFLKPRRTWAPEFIRRAKEHVLAGRSNS